MTKTQSHATSPRFSVIIPVYNRASFIARAIESVLSQTYRDFELIVVDDGSTDATPDIVALYPVRLLRQENRGVSAARNRGIASARGKIIAFLDSDDAWEPRKLEVQAAHFDAHPECMIHQTDEIWIREGKFLNKQKKHQKKSGHIFYDSLHLCLISPSAVAIRRELFDEVGVFREDFPVCEDYELWLRITRRYEVCYTPQPLVVKYGGHADQLSRRYFAMDRWRVLAMLPYIDDPKVLEVALQKCAIVLKGAQKHNNKEILDAFTPIYRKLQNKRDTLGLP